MINTTETVTTEIDGVEVTVFVKHRSAGDLTVEIISPYCNLSTCSHIAYFAREHSSFVGEYGDRRILIMSQELFQIGQFININMIKLSFEVERLNTVLEERSSNIRSYEKNKEELKFLKKKMQSGELDSKSYQSQLSRTKKESTQYICETSAMIDSFFGKNFPMAITMETQDQVLKIIEHKKPLKPVAGNFSK